MKLRDTSVLHRHEDQASLVPSRMAGVRGQVSWPFWGILGGWAVLCGALASGQLRWHADYLVPLLVVFLLAELGWGSLWDLVTGVDWFGPLLTGWPRARPAALQALPYTLEHSPAGRLQGILARFVGWWRRIYWPANGSAFLGVLAAAGLAAALALFLPLRLLPLHLVLWSLIAVGMIWRRRGQAWLAGQALAQVGLGWLAGHGALSPWDMQVLFLAMSFSLAVWGALRLAQGRVRSVLLLVAGQVLAAVPLIWLRHPLAAALVGGMIIGQLAIYPLLRQVGETHLFARRGWLWLMAAMLVVAVALR